MPVTMRPTGLNQPGRVSVHEGTGPGLTTRRLGEKSGTETVTLTTNDIPSHLHTTQQVGTSAGPNTPSPANAQPATVSQNAYNTGGPQDANMLVHDTGSTGGGGAHNNMQPYLVVNYIIALVGVYPSRS